MSLRSWSVRPSPKATARRRPLRLETLEGREVPAVVTWVGGSGDWNTATNWRDDLLVNRLPAAGDDAVIDVPAVTVTHSSGTHTVQSLTLNDAFTLAGGSLTVTGNLVQQNASPITMTAGTLRSATVAGQGGAVLMVAGGVLDGLTLGGSVGGVPTPATLQSSNNFTVVGGLTFANGSLFNLGHQVSVSGDQTVGGDGEVRFRNAYSALYTSGQIAFAPGLTIHRSDTGSSDITVNNGGSITNRATIRADAGGSIRLFSNLGSAQFINAAGGVLASDGGTLNLATDWSNAGQFVVNGSTLNLGGQFTTAGIGTIARTGGTINLTGLLDNTGSTFVLDATTGSWNLGTGGRLRRGSLVTSGGADLATVASNYGTLDGLTLGATVGGVPASATVQGNGGFGGSFTVTGGLTFTNGSLVDLGCGMVLDGDQTLGGDGEIRFRGNSGISNYHQTTFGPGLSVHRADDATTTINIVGGRITNQGTIRADAGGHIRFTGNTSILNALDGVLETADGGTLSLLTPTWSNAGQIVVDNATLNLGGSFTTAGLGAYTRTGGTINLIGLLDNTGDIFALDASTGSWDVYGAAELRGGNLVTSGGSALVAAGTNGGGTLNGVTLGGTVGGVPSSATALGLGSVGFTVTGGLTFTNGSLVDLSNGLTLVGDQTLGGDGEIRLRTGSGISNFGQTTFGPGLTLHSDAASARINMVGGSITNRGTIRVDAGQVQVSGNGGTTFTNAAEGVLTIAGGTTFLDDATNAGTVNVSGGALTLRGAWSSTGAFHVADGTLNFAGTWSNTGTVNVPGGTLNLAGNFSTGGLGTVSREMIGVVNLTGTLDNTGGTLALDEATGSWILSGGTIVGGRVTTAGPAELVAGLTAGTLNGVTLAGTVRGLDVRVTGGLTLDEGLIDVGFLGFAGSQTLGGVGTVVFSTNNPANRMVVTAANTMLTVGPGVTVRGVTGLIGSNGSGGILNQGTIAADGGGTLTVQGIIGNFTAGTLTGGTWQVVGNSTLRLFGANVSSNAADILVDGANARLFRDGGTTNALAGLAGNTAAGRLRLLNGATLATSATGFNNQGSLTVGAGTTFTVSGPYLNPGDTTIDGSLVANGVTVGEAGTLAGSGTVSGNVVNDGLVRPGTSPGQLSIAGDYTQGGTGRLDVEIGGPVAGSQYDRLSVSGSAALAGTLAVRLIDGFGPTADQTFEIMTFADHTGSFGTVTGLVPGRFPLFSLAVNPTDVELTAVANGTDLAFESFQTGSIPPDAMPGQNIGLTYTVKNLSDPPAVGPWVDSVYLSRDGVLDPGDTLFARVEHAGDLAGLGSYTATATAPLPPLADGSYRVIVVADSRGLVSDAARGNNTGVSAQAIRVTVPLLTLGTPASGTVAPGQDLYYRVLVAPGTDVTVAADFAAAPGAEVFVRYAALPDATNFDETVDAGRLHSRLLLSNTQGGTYYIRLHGLADAPGPVAYTLAAARSGFEITSLSPLRGSNRQVPSIITVNGTHFTAATQVSLRQAGGATRAATSVVFISETKLVATVSLTDLPVGNYEVVAADAEQTAVALDAFAVTNSDVGGTGAWITALAFVRVGAAIKLTLGYYNTSENPLPAPIVRIVATNVENAEDPAGSLTFDTIPGSLPGAYSKIFDPFKVYSPTPKVAGTTSNFELIVIEPSQTPMNWDTQKATLRPDTIPLDAWDAVWANLRPQLGETLSDFWQFLNITSQKLRASGEVVDSIERLFSFEIHRAGGAPAIPLPTGAVDVAVPTPGLPLAFGRSFGESIPGRFHVGRLGRGWSDLFDTSATEDAITGTVTLRQAGNYRFFGRRPDGTYESVPGDFGVLTKVGGAFRVREATGATTAFRPDGLLDFLEDTNGNRIAAGYSGTQLTALTHSNGAVLTLTYNAQGRISEIADSTGDVATYEYDLPGEHLVRVTTTAGTTEYGYTPDPTGPRAHALTTITSRDGTHLYFEYDSKGRLVRQQGDDGAAAVRFAYDTASFRVTDAADQVTTVYYDDFFRTRKVRDPLGHLSYTEYDAANHPLIVGESGAGEAGLAYDAAGNPTRVQNPIGESQTYDFESDHGRLTDWKDPLGHETRFDHDVNGNLSMTTYADGSTQTYSYDAIGNVVGTVNRMGQAMQFTYDARGQVTGKDLPGGAHVEYTYDARGNLAAVVDAAGTTQLEYLDPQNPDLLTKIVYPTGRSLAYTYESGRRTRMVDQSGFAVNYSYDAAGRLDVVSDAVGGLLVDYDYDPLGRLARETRGNFTVTTFDYDAAGQLLEITHRAPDATVQSRFAYAYDALGRCTSVTTLEGVTAYEYDGAGRLTSVALPTGRRLTYSYDAAGNRTVVGDNGTPTTYAANDLNQYGTVGPTAQAFDAGGNLASSTGPAGTTNYLYDAEGRLVSQTSPAGTWAYEYDALGNRIASTHDGVRSEYLVDPLGLGNVVGEYDGAGQLRANYVQGVGLASRVGAGGPAAFYQFDATGNTTQLTGAGGTVLNAYSYLPFGEPLSASESVANPFEYVGQFGVMRDGSGIDYMRNRWYDPAQGRFTQADPIGLAGGTNSYSYVENNPVGFVDPSGLVVAPSLYAAYVFAQTAWQGYAVATGLVSPMAYEPPGLNGTPGPVWSPQVPVSPLAQRIGTQGLNYSQFSAQVERAAAEQAAQAWRAGANRTLARGGIYALAAADIAAFLLASQALFQKEASLFAGHELGCTPGIPESFQVCDPGLSFFTGKKVQGFGVVQQNPSRDPNDLVGPAGYGAANFVVPQATLPYQINFQNDPAAAGPAAEVVVTQVLDADLDIDTFALDDFGFGAITVPVPAGRDVYATRIDLRPTRGIFVEVAAGLDRLTRTVTWRFQAIDPETLDLPVSPFVGFLPPDVVAPEGQGFVGYHVRPNAGAATGTEIPAVAAIVFDTNDPIYTNQVDPHDPTQGTDPAKEALVTIDAGGPTSAVAPLPAAVNSTTIPLNWAGADDSGGSGIVGYDVFVSDDGGAYTLFRDDTLETSAVFPARPGHTYSFYSLATDGVGHEQTDFTPVTTTIGGAPGRAFTFFDDDGDRYTASLNGPGQIRFLLDDPDLDGNGPVGLVVLENTDPAKSKLAVTIKKGPAGDGRVSIDAIEGTGIKSIAAAASDLTGAGIDLSGPLGGLTVRDVKAGATIRTAGTPAGKTRITTHMIEAGAAFHLGTSVTTFKAAAVGAATITAPSLGTLSVRGDAKNKVNGVRTPIRGDFAADLVLTGTGDPKKPTTLTTATISGDVVSGGWAIAGRAGAIAIRGATAGWSLDVTGPIQSLNLGPVTDATVVAGGAIGSVKAKGWAAGRLTATSLGTLTVSGDLGADVTLTGAAAGKPALTTATVSGTVSGSTISAAGTLNSFAAGAFRNSSLLAGFTPTDPSDPFAGGTFLTGATLNHFTVTGFRGVPAPAFGNSVVGATAVDTIKLKSVDVDNAGRAFGLIVNDLMKKLTIATPSVALMNVTDDPTLPPALGDFAVRVL